jgi:hypothetical protein
LTFEPLEPRLVMAGVVINEFVADNAKDSSTRTATAQIGSSSKIPTPPLSTSRAGI